MNEIENVKNTQAALRAAEQIEAAKGRAMPSLALDMNIEHAALWKSRVHSAINSSSSTSGYAPAVIAAAQALESAVNAAVAAGCTGSIGE